MALISVHIPYSSLRNSRSDHKVVVRLIADKTRTHIELYQLSHLFKIRFCIFGKWRDCLQAGRLLWYHTIRETTIYMHSDWNRELSRGMKDQNDKPFGHLYKNISFKAMKEFNLISISGICWDVLKFRRELSKRNNTKAIEPKSNGNKLELMALQVLNSIRTDINDDIHCPESIYSIRGSQLLHLITGRYETIVCETNDIESDKEPQLDPKNPVLHKLLSPREVNSNLENLDSLTNSEENLDTNSDIERFDNKQQKSLPFICQNRFSDVSLDEKINAEIGYIDNLDIKADEENNGLLTRITRPSKDNTS